MDQMALPLRCAVSLRLTERAPFSLAVCDRGSETLRRNGIGDGKSETCRASEWQSHNQDPKKGHEVMSALRALIVSWGTLNPDLTVGAIT